MVASQPSQKIFAVEPSLKEIELVEPGALVAVAGEQVQPDTVIGLKDKAVIS
jgi:hypothetical protein